MPFLKILAESMVEGAALGWFEELGYAVLPGPQLAPGEPGAEGETFSDVVLVGRLRESIRQLKPATSKAPQTTVSKSETVQIDWWLNS
jgi:type I restriction enzyme R subunit